MISCLQFCFNFAFETNLRHYNVDDVAKPLTEMALAPWTYNQARRRRMNLSNLN